MRKKRHLLSRTTALLLAASLIRPAAAYAETGQRLIALLGDITDDMLVTGLDVFFLGSYLCLNPNGLRRDLTPEKCDLDENGTVDAVAQAAEDQRRCAEGDL